MASVGYVGLGAMGGLMVERLLEKGHQVTGYNRTRSKAERLIEKRMAWADSPRQVAEAADIILSMVANDAALLDVADGPNGMIAGLKPNQIWVDMSTVGAGTARSLVERVRATGADMVDAPVSGSTVTLKKGPAHHGWRPRGHVRASQAAAARYRPQGDSCGRQRQRIDLQDCDEP